MLQFTWNRILQNFHWNYQPFVHPLRMPRSSGSPHWLHTGADGEGSSGRWAEPLMCVAAFVKCDQTIFKNSVPDGECSDWLTFLLAGKKTWKVYCNPDKCLETDHLQFLNWCFGGTRNLLSDSSHRNYMNLPLGQGDLELQLPRLMSINVGFHCCMIGVVNFRTKKHVLPHFFALPVYFCILHQL